MENEKKLWEVVSLRNIVLLNASAYTSLRHESPPAESPVLWLDYAMNANPIKEFTLIEVIGSFYVRGMVGEDKTPVLLIELKHRLTYDVPGDFPLGEDSLREFAYTSGILSIWPYWREITHSFYRQMELPMPPLPVYRVGRGIDGVTPADPAATLKSPEAQGGHQE